LINSSKTSPEQIDNDTEVDDGIAEYKIAGLNYCRVNTDGKKGIDLGILF